MAVYNEVQVGRYVRFLQKFLSIKGRQPAPLTYSGELSSFWSLFHGVENRYLEGWNEFGLLMSQGPVAAQISAVQLRNPIGSNVVAVVSAIDIQESGAEGGISIQNAVTADLATVQNAVSLDKRYWAPGNTPNRSVLIPSRANNVVGSGFNVFGAGVAANLPFQVIQTENQEFPILPGDGLFISTSAVNVTLNVYWRWRERILEESERT